MTHAMPPSSDGESQQPQQPMNYGIPPTQQAHYAGAPAPAPRKRKWPLILGIVVVVLLICGGIGVATLFAGGKAVTDSLQEVQDDQKGLNAVAGKLGQATTDGNFEFTAHSIKCGVPQLGDGAVKAQGQFCLVKITVKNVGKESDFYDGSSQKAYDVKGTEYSHDPGASSYANEGTSTFLESINPGNKTDGTLVFDVPAEVKITSVVLHDSLLSPGVRFTF
jgi:hypothetical protein